MQGAIAGTLLKRLGRPENIAQAVVFFVENDYVTGVCLPVDGGRTIAEGGVQWSPLLRERVRVRAAPLGGVCLPHLFAPAAE